jgi:ATP-dependent helicase/nuclease subunit A
MVEWFNHALPHALARSENSDYGAVTYAPAAAAREASRVAPVELHRIPESRAEAEAKCVADIVEESEGKVAILVRARKDAAGIVRELNRRRIRFQAVDMDPLTERQTVLDLHSLARAVQYPADRTALYAVLRGPLCGLTLAELTAYAAGEPLPARGEAAMERIERARRERWRRPLRESVEELWLEMGGSAALHSEAQFAEAQAYLELLETAPGEAELETELGKLFAPPDPAPEARVQIMTMHKAKGLEFDTVILPGLGRQQRNPQTPLLRWWERSRGGRSALLVGSVKATGSEGDRIYSFLQEVETRRQRHENGRLLYVAATRARRKLHLAGWLNDAKDEPAANSMLAALWPAIGEDFLRLTSLAAAAPLPAAAGEVRRLAAGWIPPKRPAPLDWELAEALPGEEIAFDWSGEPLRLVGTLVHRLLQQMAKEGLAAWPAARVAGLRGYVAGTLRAMGVPGAELEAAVDRAMQAVEAAAAGERGRWILDAHAEAVSEWEIAGAAGGRLRHVRIDRSFVDVDGVRWIIDYKTSSHEGGGLEEFLNNERERYRAQMEGYAELVTALDGRPVRLGLYFPLLGGWREWAYAPPSVSLPAGSGSGREGD